VAVEQNDLVSRRQSLAALSGLDDPVRGQLYEFVVSAAPPVSREEAAAAAGIAAGWQPTISTSLARWAGSPPDTSAPRVGLAAGQAGRPRSTGALNASSR
jgi:hypothetical protein